MIPWYSAFLFAAAFLFAIAFVADSRECVDSVEFVGVVKDFEVSAGGWGSSDKAKVELDNGDTILISGYNRFKGIETGSIVYSVEVTNCYLSQEKAYTLNDIAALGRGTIEVGRP